MRKARILRLLLLLLAISALAQSTDHTHSAAEAFRLEYGKWATFRNARVEHPDTLSAPEMMQWQAVKTAWRKLQKTVDAEYRGE